MIRWLEAWLRKFRGTVILVTHDRYFLERVVNHITELSWGKLYHYEANYSKYLELKAERAEMAEASERKRQSILRTEREWIMRGCRARTTKQQARLDRLEALKAGRAPVFDKTVELDSVETRMGKKTIELHHVSKEYEGRKIVEDFTYIFLKNQTIAFVGPNGCGKSTLLKMIAGQIPPDSGDVEVGETIKLGYFAQELPQMDENQRVIDYVKDIAEYISTRDGRITASQMLERFLFTPDMQYAPIGKLSGGEKRRLYLLGVLQTGPNVLVMDEVSNELDIPTLTILEDYLNSFIGIVILVSHDRYFINQTATRILDLSPEGIVNYKGNYNYYLEQKEAGNISADSDNITLTSATDAAPAPSPEKAKEDWKRSREEAARQRKRANDLKKTEKEISRLEEENDQLKEEMALPENATNVAKLMELNTKFEENEAALLELYDKWEELSE